MPDMPKLHERERIYSAAKTDLNEQVLNVLDRHDLTETETIKLMNDVCSSFISSCAKYMIRRERHGDEEKPGGFE